MKIFIRSLFFLFFGLMCFQPAGAHKIYPDKIDSVQMAPGDSVKVISEQEKPREHIPAKATMFSAVLPGLGQIYNKKYWKLPIVYGGFIGLGYMINSYNSSYLTNKQYYYDLDDDDPETNSFITYFGDVSDRSVSSMQTTLQDAIEENRRDRDFWVIITAAFYLLNVLDANVDAHFITFDISEDLTFNLEPFYIDHFTSTPLLGAQVSFTF